MFVVVLGLFRCPRILLINCWDRVDCIALCFMSLYVTAMGGFITSTRALAVSPCKKYWVTSCHSTV